MEQGVHVGGWEVVGEIDRGALACVYEGRGETPGQPIAVEVLLPGPAQDAGVRARFLRGAGAQAGVRHPSLVRVHAAGDGPPAPFVVCDLHGGPHLADRLRQGDLGLEEAIEQLGDIAEALDALHAADVVHGALQPDAILGDGPHALLTGVGRGTSGEGGLVAEQFRAPELTPEAPASAAGDRFALAALVFLTLTGGLPFAPPPAGAPSQTGSGRGAKAAKGKRAKRRAEAAETEQHAHGGDDADPFARGVTSVRALRPELPRQLDELFAGALAADPAARPASAEALVEAVRDALGSDGLALGPAPATAALGLPRPAAGPGPTLETVNGTNGHSPTDAPVEPSSVVLTGGATGSPELDPEPQAVAPATDQPRTVPEDAPEDDRAIAAVRYVRVAQPVLSDWTPPHKRSHWFKRWFARLLALVMVLAAGGAIAYSITHFLDLSSEDDAPAPALPNGLYTLGSALSPGDVVRRDCRDRPGDAGSPACTVLQVGLNGSDGKGRRLIVQKPSTIRAWAVRGAKGSMSIQVLRRVGDETVAVAKSDAVTVPDTGVHRYKVAITVQPGDHVGLLLGVGAQMGLRKGTPGALTERFLPSIGKSQRKPTYSRKGFMNEIMLRVDLATKSSEQSGG